MYQANAIHQVEIKAAAWGLNKNGTPNVTVDFLVLGMEVPGEDQLTNVGQEMRSISYYFATDENARISMDQLKRIGFAGAFPDDFETGNHGLTGKVLRAKCVHDSYTDANGMTRHGEKWTFVTGSGRTQSLKAPDAAAAATFKAKFGKMWERVKGDGDHPGGQAQGKPKPQGGAPAQGAEAGDVPW